MLDSHFFGPELSAELLAAYRAQGLAYCPECESDVPLRVKYSRDSEDHRWAITCLNVRCGKRGGVQISHGLSQRRSPATR
jgi:hypothetical protein